MRKKRRTSVEYHPTGIRHIDLTRVQRASSETARRINRDIVLELIREHQPTSRADLSCRSGLQRSTVSQIVEQLIRERWVREGPVAISARGRRPTMLGLNCHRPSSQYGHRRRGGPNGRLLSRSQVPVSSDPEVLGNTHRNQFRGPGQTVIDASVFRGFHMYRESQFQIRFKHSTY
jgi:hypothetical protein